MLTRLDRCGIGQRIRSIAATHLEPGPRSLHAIHLATAQIAASIAPLAALITYDTRVGEAATELGHTSCSAGCRSIARQSPIVFERASIQLIVAHDECCGIVETAWRGVFLASHNAQPRWHDALPIRDPVMPLSWAE